MIVALLVSHNVMQVTISSDEEKQQFDDGNTSKSDELSDKWSSDGNSSEEGDESKVNRKTILIRRWLFYIVFYIFCHCYLGSMAIPPGQLSPRKFVPMKSNSPRAIAS